MSFGSLLLRQLSLLFTLIAVSLLPLESIAEISPGLYGGTVFTKNTDVQLTQSGGTDLTFSNVSWDDESL